MRIRKTLAIAVTALFALSLSACGGGGAPAGGGEDATEEKDVKKIGIAMPTKSSERWIADGNNLKEQLEAKGYTVDLQYAEDDIPTQANQIDNMITQGSQILVIASIDGTALSSQLDNAAENGIKVIAYDRLIRENANVDYYTSFDNEDVGRQMGTSLLQGLGLFDADGKPTDKEGTFNIEVFGGSPDDNNAGFFFNGAMEVLKPFLDSGTIKIPSGQDDFRTVATLRWDAGTAQSRLENLITAHYAGDMRIDGILSPLDSMSVAMLGALKGAGYGTDAQPYPVITGQDSDVMGVKSILAGEQYSTIYKDTRKLAEVTVNMVDAIAQGKDAEVNDTETYDNGVKIVPSYLLKSEIITKENVQSSLVDSGYYTAADLDM